MMLSLKTNTAIKKIQIQKVEMENNQTSITFHSFFIYLENNHFSFPHFLCVLILK